jgi:putative FmdB family regulatory protein
MVKIGYMPTYDYICLDCHRRFDIFLTFREYGVKSVTCSHCGSSNVRRRVPRVRVLRSDEQRLSTLSDPSALEGIEDDPRAMAKMFREMGGALGEETPPQFNEVVDRLEAGQSPEEIESAMPDWGGMEGSDDHSGHDHSLDD